MLEEVREVAARPAIAARFGLSEEKTILLLNNVANVAVTVVEVPTLYEHPYDPDDSHYVNLALAAAARLVVSRDRDLLNLMERNRQEGQEFQRRFSKLRIVDSVELLRELRTW